MEQLTERKQRVLDLLDTEIDSLEKKLQKVQPLINELNQLKQTRRVLLAEKGTTSGGGNSRAQLTMEMVVDYLRKNDGGVQPAEIAEHYGIDGAIVRSHLNRGKDTRYELTDGGWVLTESADAEEE